MDARSEIKTLLYIPFQSQWIRDVFPCLLVVSASLLNLSHLLSKIGEN